VFVLVLIAGCQKQPAVNGANPTAAPAAAAAEAEIKANLAKLSPEDRQLAEQQQYCPVMPASRLGEMGKPHKVDVNGQLLLVCCENCVRAAQSDPEKTLAQLKEIMDRSRAKAAK
jgi:hypothetical protein